MNPDWIQYPTTALDDAQRQAESIEASYQRWLNMRRNNMQTRIETELTTITVTWGNDGLPLMAAVPPLDNLPLGLLQHKCPLPDGYEWSRVAPFEAHVVEVRTRPLAPSEIDWLEMMCAETAAPEEYSSATEGRW